MSPFEPGSQHRVGNTIVANANVGNENNADGKVVLIEFFHYIMGWSAVYKLTESVPYLLNRVGVRMGELFSRRIASHGVSLPMYRVMAALWEVPHQRLNDLAAMTTIEISTLSRLIGTMEKMRLVSRSRLENNARTVAINLTKEGDKLVTELMPIAQHFEEVAVAKLPPATLKMFKKTLIDVYDRLDAIEDEMTVADAAR